MVVGEKVPLIVNSVTAGALYVVREGKEVRGERSRRERAIWLLNGNSTRKVKVYREWLDKPTVARAAAYKDAL